MSKKRQDRVRAQYEGYPYPERDPNKELKFLHLGSPSHIDEICHYGFNGKAPFEKDFRILVAGGGTGDALIMMAQQLKNRKLKAEIHYVDLSSQSRAIAEKRAAKRGLKKDIVFHSGSLTEIDHLGQFDYIDCCGVLHHLPEPLDGFKALSQALKPDGAMGVMVYGTLGRLGVYHMQDMMRMIDDGEDDPTKVELAKTLSSGLPPTNWLMRNPLIQDHNISDAGVYDLFLHSIDRSYTVPEFLQVVEQAGLAPTSFIQPGRYDPLLWIRDESLRGKLEALPKEKQWEFAELFLGNCHKHVAYLTHKDRVENRVASPHSQDAIPFFHGEFVSKQLKKMLPGSEMSLDLGGVTMTMRMTPAVLAILHKVDGQRTLEQIQKSLPGNPDWFAFKGLFDSIYRILNGMNKMLIRYR